MSEENEEKWQKLYVPDHIEIAPYKIVKRDLDRAAYRTIEALMPELLKDGKYEHLKHEGENDDE